MNGNEKTPREFSFRQVLVPTEHKTSDGGSVFRTQDRQLYHRDPNGSIRRVGGKKKVKRANN